MSKFNFKKNAIYSIKNKKWKIIDSYRINWEDRSTSVEYKLKSENNKAIKYLEVYTQGSSVEYSIWTSQTFPKNLLNTKDFEETIEFKSKNYPKKITYKSVSYLFEEACSGIYSDDYDKEEMYAITYIDALKTKLLSIEFYEDETELSVGEKINASNIQYLEQKKPSFFDSGFVKFIGRNLAMIGFVLFIGFIFIADACNDDEEKTDRNSNGIYRHRSTGGGGK